MKKRIFCFSIILCLLLSGCGDGAKKAFDRLLSGDLTVLSENDYEVPDFSGGGYEYIKLDADGDGDDELFVRKTDDPGGYNGAFDFQDGELSCLHNDKTNVKAYDYPLKNGKMVRQFDLNDASTYTVFEYIENGRTRVISELYIREIPYEDEPCPSYTIDRKDVSKDEFSAALDLLVTSQQLEKDDWTKIE